MLNEPTYDGSFVRFVKTNCVNVHHTISLGKNVTVSSTLDGEY